MASNYRLTVSKSVSEYRPTVSKSVSEYRPTGSKSVSEYRSWAQVAKSAIEPKKQTILSECYLTKQSEYTISEIIRYIPFVDQITLWQTGDLNWRSLYKLVMQTTTTVLILDEKFCKKMLESHCEVDLEKNSSNIFNRPTKFCTGILSVLKPYPRNIFNKIPKWIRFHKIYFSKIGCAINNCIYNIPSNKNESCLADLRDLFLQSCSVLKNVYTKSSVVWIFDLLSQTKIFTVLTNFECLHIRNCDCCTISMRMPGSGLYLAGTHCKNFTDNFSVENADTVSDVRLSIFYSDTIVSRLRGAFAKVITRLSTLPNLVTIEVVLDLNASQYYYKDVIDFYIRQMQIKCARNICFRLIRGTNYNDLCSGRHEDNSTVTAQYTTFVSELKKLVTELNFGILSR
jgi:hypothetical protein